MAPKFTTVPDAIAFLNSLLDADRKAISELFFCEVEPNVELIMNPTVQVGAPMSTADDIVAGRNDNSDFQYVLRPIGVINGMFGACPVCAYGFIQFYIDLVDGKWEIQEFTEVIHDKEHCAGRVS